MNKNQYGLWMVIGMLMVGAWMMITTVRQFIVAKKPGIKSQRRFPSNCCNALKHRSWQANCMVKSIKHIVLTNTTTLQVQNVE